MDPYTGAILASASSPGLQRQPVRQRGAAGARAVARPQHQQHVRARLGHEDVHGRGGASGRGREARDDHPGRARAEVRRATRSTTSTAAASATSRSGTSIAQSRNIGTAKIAARLAPHNHQKAARILFDTWDRLGMVGPTGIDLPGETAGWWYDPRDVPLGARGPRQPLLRPGRLRDAHAARHGLRALHERRLPRAAPRRRGRDRRRACQGAGPGREGRRTDPGPAHVRDRLGPDLCQRGAHPRARGGRQDRHRPDLGSRRAGTARPHVPGDWKPNRFNSSFVGFIGSDEPEVLIAVRIEEAKPIDLEPLTLQDPVVRAVPHGRQRRHQGAGHPQGEGPPGRIAGARDERGTVRRSSTMSCSPHSARPCAAAEAAGGRSPGSRFHRRSGCGQARATRGEAISRAGAADDPQTTPDRRPDRRYGQGRQGGSPDTDT